MYGILSKFCSLLLGLFDSRKSCIIPLLGLFASQRSCLVPLLGLFASQRSCIVSLLGLFTSRRSCIAPLLGLFASWRSCLVPLLGLTPNGVVLPHCWLLFDSHTTSRFRCCFLDTQDTNYQKTYKNVWNKYFVNAQKVEPGSCCKIVKNHCVKIDNSPHLRRYRADGQQEISRELLWSITIHNIHVTVPRLSLFINYCQFSNFWCNKYIKRITVTVCVN